ncbi:MAG: ABC transporter substrate-binding protein [Solirubrobacteraceae bacterium]
MSQFVVDVRSRWRRVTLAALAVVALGSVAVLSSSAHAASAKTIHIAWIYDITGPLAPVNYPDGVLAAVDSINAAGGIDGAKIALTKYDGQSTAAGTLSATQRAIATHPSGVILQSILGYTAVPALQAAGIPTVGWGAAPGESSAANTDFFSATGDIATHNSDAWLQVLAAQGATKIALVSGTLEEPDMELLKSLAATDGFTVPYYNAGLEMLVDAPTELSVAQAIQSSGATGVVIFGCDNCQGISVDLNQLGDKIPVIQTSVFGPSVIKDYGASANNMEFSEATANPYASGDPGITAYRNAMVKYKLTAQEFTPYAIVFYAATEMLADGLKTAGAPFKPAKVATALNNLKNYTANGIIPDATFGTGANSWHVLGSACLSSAKIENGKWVSVNNGKAPWVCSKSGDVATPTS